MRNNIDLNLYSCDIAKLSVDSLFVCAYMMNYQTDALKDFVGRTEVMEISVYVVMHRA